jgi:hypothetical protein
MPVSIFRGRCSSFRIFFVDARANPNTVFHSNDNAGGNSIPISKGSREREQAHHIRPDRPPRQTFEPTDVFGTKPVTDKNILSLKPSLLTESGDESEGELLDTLMRFSWSLG